MTDVAEHVHDYYDRVCSVYERTENAKSVSFKCTFCGRRFRIIRETMSCVPGGIDHMISHAHIHLRGHSAKVH